MESKRYIRLAVVMGIVIVTATFFVGLRIVSATQEPEELVLQLSELPEGAWVQIDSPLTPGSWNNGFVHEDGSDIVHGYIDGARRDFIVPGGGYIASLVYRFADQSAAASEFQRLTNLVSELYTTSTDVSGNGRQAAMFETSDPEVTYATHRMVFIQRGKFLFVLKGPGPIDLAAFESAAQSGTDVHNLTVQDARNFNQTAEKLFEENMALLLSR